MSWMLNLGEWEKELDAAKARQEQMKNFSGNDLERMFIKLEEGENVVRLLPTWRTPDHPLYHKPHFVLVVDHSFLPNNGGSHRCLDKTYPEKVKETGISCAVCRVQKRLMDEGIISSYKDLGKKPYLSRKYNTGAMNRKEQDSRARVLGIPSSLYLAVIAAIAQAAREGENLLDPNNGSDLIITRVNEVNKVSYTPTFKRSKTPIASSSELTEQALKSMIDLDRMFGWPSDEKLAAAEKAAEAMYVYYRDTRKSVQASVQKQQPSEPAPQSTPTPAPPVLDVSSGSKGRDCFGNHNASLPFCLDCRDEMKCADESVRTGGNSDKPKPQEVQAKLTSSVSLPW